MSQATVHSTICGFEHIIQGKRDGKTVIIDIKTPCEKIQRMSHIELTVKEVIGMEVKDNPVMAKAQESHCGTNCLVPCGIMHVCRIEAGLLAESLCKRVGGVSITFGDE
jgi:hypothetical protein